MLGDPAIGVGNFYEVVRTMRVNKRANPPTNWGATTVGFAAFVVLIIVVLILQKVQLLAASALGVLQSRPRQMQWASVCSTR